MTRRPESTATMAPAMDQPNALPLLSGWVGTRMPKIPATSDTAAHSAPHTNSQVTKSIEPLIRPAASSALRES